MSENDNLNPKIEWQEAPKDALSRVIEELKIPPEIEQSIRWLKWENKDLCIISLEDILKEFEEWKLWIADRDQKIKNTLAEEYNIVILTNKITQTKENEKTKEKEVNEKNNEHKLLLERLTKVKELNPDVVSKELEIAKTNNPLPNEVKLTIAKSSNSTPEQVDAVLKWENNPQISNLIDTYYLSQGETIRAIETKLSPKENEKALAAFWDLQASAREFWLPYTERAANVKALISNQSDATQWKVIETVNSLTKWAPDTVITRDGDRLSWEDKKWSKYEIDMAVRPPKLAKSLNGLSISKEIESVSPEQKEKQILEDKKSKVTEVVIKDAGKVQLNAPENIPDSIQDKTLIESYRWAQEWYQKAKNPTEKLETLKTLKEQNHLLEWERRKSMTTENMSDDKYAKLEEGLFKEMDWLNQLEVSLSDFIETDKKLLTYQWVESKWTIESFDNNADANLSYLVGNNFDKLGPSANEAMNRIITEINRTRTSNNQIDLTERLNQATDGKVLIQALEKLWGTPDIFTNGEKLPQFQDTITAAVTKNADNPWSIESLIRSN